VHAPAAVLGRVEEVVDDPWTSLLAELLRVHRPPSYRLLLA